MYKVNVESSNINSIGYENGELVVEFKGGSSYKYLDVPQEMFINMINSESKGKFLAENLKNKYEFIKL